MTTFAIAALQLALEQKDNCAEIADEVRRLKRRFPWLRMALIGELAAYGANLDQAQALPGPAEAFFCALARETDLWLLPGSLYERRGGAIFNTCPVINPAGEVIARYSKMYPFTPYERGVSAGAESVVFDVPGVGRFGVSICYDMWFAETTRTLAWKGAEVVLHPSMTNTIDRDVEICMARASAAANQCYFFDVNVAGALGNGRSVIAGPGGEIIHQAGEAREIMPVEVDFDYVRRVRASGWHGLGQPLKSFRDGARSFAPYQAKDRSEHLDGLGPLLKPGEPISADGKVEHLRKKT
ncbi:carbon-nitrogen hydrolase family protein [Terricaulis sp.]|uniref:carbon-nitrogen hydrolase family protein n=1 Tax=Terricaulis sp. TaxID=2768686 RepID=UPI002AC65DBB|nr:carbon-nitrogen hydrolase family protein [Terricaulis sp.]MDZ4691830.1 carbon-nitrogen hydrolase family protein [Terricaulis sp.]